MLHRKITLMPHPVLEQGRPATCHPAARTAERLRLVANSGVALFAALSLGACTSLGGTGPYATNIKHLSTASYANTGIQVISLNSESLSRIVDFERSRTFANQLGDFRAQDPVIGPGDVLDIAVWEAPPAVLFGAAANPMSAELGAQNRTMIQQVVGTDGTISIPFAGRMAVAGKTMPKIEHDIVHQLTGKANDPQVIVRLDQNDARNVTVLGEVTASGRVPIGARGERLLDAIASAGGARQPVAQTTVQLSRGAMTVNMPLDKVIRDPQQNIRIKPGDVVTLLFQPYSFTAMGAVSNPAEIRFEGGGISLAQALGRTGGLRDDRASVHGVFVFRLEDPSALDPKAIASAHHTAHGHIPVVYQLDLGDPTGFFVAQDFMMHDKDVVYVSTAPGADLSRFLSAVANFTFTATNIGTQLKN